MDRRTGHIVRLRAGGFCEYCRLPQSVAHVQFPIDHVTARQHGGSSDEDNLAVACPTCNLHKGPNIAGIDAETGKLTRLFHPRRDQWRAHFRWDGASLVGLTPVGRTTIQVLGVNEPNLIKLRQALIECGLFPRDPLPSGRSSKAKKPASRTTARRKRR